MKHDETLTLGQHSLHAVVRANKSLWQRPQRWTQAHLQALGVNRRCDVVIEDGHDQDDGPSLHALIPEMRFLERAIRSLSGWNSYGQKTGALFSLLLFDKRPPRLYLDPNLETEVVPFKCQDRVLKLVVGQRAYRLEEALYFELGRLSFVFLDAYTLRRRFPRCAVVDLEPCIAGILIAVAQTQAQKNGPSGTGESVITTRLLFTDQEGDQDSIRVYTARVSLALLKRFRYPNRPPAGACKTSDSTPSLLRLQHVRVPYKPIDTFTARILAALSVPAITVIDELQYPASILAAEPIRAVTIVQGKNYAASRKRASVYARGELDRKRPRREGPRTPLDNADPNRSCALLRPDEVKYGKATATGPSC